MRKQKKIKDNARSRYALANMILYQFLLVATPFLLVRNYLQQAIGIFSQWSFAIWGLRIPYVLGALSLLLLFILVYNIRRIKLKHILIFSGVVLLLWLGQSQTDYYFNHDFYELQHNWHYIAYGIFAWISYLYHKSRGASHLRYIWQTLLMGQIISIFDETAQVFLSSRVFDICDIGKDFWGVVVGMIAITAAASDKLDHYKFKLWHRKPRDYFLNPYSSLFLILVYGLIFLVIGSILTETRYLLNAVIWTWGIFILATLIFHFLQFKVSRIITLILLCGSLIFAGITLSRNRQTVIVHKKAGLLSWRGLPIPYFDMMIRKDGTIKLVDKKIYFNKKDKMNRIYGMTGDILLIGSGSQGQGGRGFTQGKSHFVYNPVTRKPLQILVYPNHQACRIYNRLNSQGKKILFIIHNS